MLGLQSLRTPKSWWLLLLTSLFIASTGCTSVFFQPSKSRFPFREQDGLTAREFFLPSEDGTQLAAWYFPAIDNMLKRPSTIGSVYSAPRALVVQWHGNAENMSSHYRYLGWLPAHGYDLLTFDYRGYGASQGEINTKGIYEDARAMIRHASRIAAEKGLPLVFVGQSLGGSLLLRALQDVHPRNLRLVVIESAFYSHRQIARETLAKFWLTWPLQWLAPILVTDAYRPGGPCLKRLPEGVPLILVYSDRDPVIPVHHGEQLFRELKEPKEFWRHSTPAHVVGMFAEGGKFREMFLERIESAIRPASSRGDQSPNDVDVRQMVNHLIETKGDPISGRAYVREAAEIPGTCLDSVHQEMNAEIDQSQPPHRSIEEEDDHERHDPMHSAMQRKRKHEIPRRAELLEHIRELQREIGDEMLDLVNHQQEKYRLEVHCARQGVALRFGSSRDPLAES